MQLVARACWILLFALMAAACGGGGSSTSNPNPFIADATPAGRYAGSWTFCYVPIARTETFVEQWTFLRRSATELDFRIATLVYRGDACRGLQLLPVASSSSEGIASHAGAVTASGGTATCAADRFLFTVGTGGAFKDTLCLSGPGGTLTTGFRQGPLDAEGYPATLNTYSSR